MYKIVTIQSYFSLVRLSSIKSMYTIQFFFKKKSFILNKVLSTRLMNQTLKVKLKIRGKCLIISVKDQEPISSIIRLLKTKDLISPSTPDNQIEIKNNWNRLDLIPVTKVREVEVNQKLGLREIEIIDKKYSHRPLESTFYDVQSQQKFIAICQNVLNNDHLSLQQLLKKKQISSNLFEILIKLKDRMKKIQDPAKQMERQKLQADKFNKLLSLNKQSEDKLRSATEQIQTLHSYIGKMFEKQFFAKIEAQSKLSKQSIKVLNDLSQKIDKKIQAIHEECEIKIAESCQMVRNQIKSNKKLMDYSLLYKSRTFQLQDFKEKLPEYSQKLRQFVEDYTKNEIVEIKSCFFVDGRNASTFINEVKGKANSILLFSSAQKLFGIFSIDAFGVKNKSGDGFLFWLSQGKAYPLKQKQPVWKASNIEIKIGNDSLMMAESNQLKMRQKKALKESFEIAEQEANRLIGKEIQITSFEVLTVSFKHAQIQKNQAQLYESVYLKTEESV